MDRDESIRRAEIAMAWAKGEAVDMAREDDRPVWQPIPGPENNYMPPFFNPTYQFRLKPQPLECWAWFDADFENRASGTRDTTVVCLARGEPYSIRTNGRWVRMREVTNETDD